MVLVVARVVVDRIAVGVVGVVIVFRRAFAAKTWRAFGHLLREVSCGFFVSGRFACHAALR